MANDVSVHTGLWTNHQYNFVQGATLTLTAKNASYLVAFLALYLGIVAGHFWTILSFTVFHIRSTRTRRTGQHHQQQAILRNYHAPGAAIWQLLNSAWSWRQQRGFRGVIQTLPVAAIALINLTAFAAAGILSARVASNHSEVLIRGFGCGFWSQTESPDHYVARAAYRANLAEDLDLATTMAAMCQKNSSTVSGCTPYAPQKMAWYTSTNVTCPFHDRICYQNATVRFDSGLIDSMVHLGINAAKKDRVLYRTVAECSPLVRDGYVQDWHNLNGTKFMDGDVLQAYPDELFLELFYGYDTIDGFNSTIFYSRRESSHTVFSPSRFSIA
jgi:hypothetical protein